MIDRRRPPLLSPLLPLAAVLLAFLVIGGPLRAEPETAPDPAVSLPGSTSDRVELEEAEAAIEALAPEVAEIRGHQFRRSVPVGIIDDAAAREHVLSRLDRFYSEGALEAEQRAYILLGLLPEGTDLVEQYLEVLEEQAGGFYDPARKSFFILGDMPSGMTPVVVAHELTHALEDQHFDLDRRLEDALPDADLVFARSAVHEGSATLVMSLYMAKAFADGSLAPADLEAFGETEAARGEKLMAMPAALRRPLMGAYLLGMGFLLQGDLSRMFSGFPKDDVDRCYRAGPVSSEQILHPEKYWSEAGRDDPEVVELGEAGRKLGRGWKKKGSGVLGELILGAMVGAPTPLDMSDMAAFSSTAWSNQAAAGWDGDRWELWSRKGSDVALLLTVWDGPDDALEFAGALPERAGLTWRVDGSWVAVVAGEAGENAGRVLEAMIAGAGRKTDESP
jgi:hypothetical protein